MITKKQYKKIAKRLADAISAAAVNKGENKNGIYFLEYDELVNTIKNFYKEQLNGKL